MNHSEIPERGPPLDAAEAARVLRGMFNLAHLDYAEIDSLAREINRYVDNAAEPGLDELPKFAKVAAAESTPIMRLSRHILRHSLQQRK